MLLDESGFMLQPVVRRTWAPRGPTPILSEWDRHDRLSVISAITVSPRRRRLGLVFDILDHNIDPDDFETFIEKVLRRIGRPIVLVLDRYSVHRCGVARLRPRFPKRVQVEWLPAYAPDLNPVEQVWNRAKHVDLANYAPNDALSLGRAAAPPRSAAAAPPASVLPALQAHTVESSIGYAKINRGKGRDRRGAFRPARISFLAP